MTDHDMVDVEAAPRDSWPARVGGGFRRALHSRRNRVVAGIAVTAVVLASGTGAVYAATQGATGNYRTAVAEVADVSETLALSGQLASSSSVGAAFQVDGTVSQVLVALGDTVSAGQQLATLDVTDLEDAVTSAKDAVANAEQTLEDDLESQASGTSTTSAASTASPSTATSTSTSSSSGSSSSSGGGDSSTSGGESSTAEDEARLRAIADVSDAQQALLTQYDAATTAGDASSAALAQAQEICAPFLSAQLDDDAQNVETETGPDAEADADDEAETVTEGSEATAPDAADSDTSDDLETALETAQTQLAECQTAVSASQDAQSTTSTANTALTDAATALNAKVAALQALLGTGSSAGTPGGGTSESTTGETAATAPSTSSGSAAESSTSATPSGGSGATGGASSATITAERILADQAAIDLAEAELAIARQNATFASLTTPVSGTVVGVALAAGDSVSAASDSAVITVQGDGGYIVQATASLSRIATVAVGQSAEIALPAFGSTFSGEVASIGVLDVSETSTPSYTVTVSVDAGEDSPRVGATANVEIELSDAVDVLTVPTSAITRSGSTATVRQLVDGELTTAEVTLGAVGSERTEILDGLDEGDAVVLADLDQVITSDDEESTSTGLTGIGGSGGEDVMFGGGGFGGGTFPTDGDVPAPPGG